MKVTQKRSGAYSRKRTSSRGVPRNKNGRRIKILVQGVALVAVVGVGFWLAQLAEDNEAVRTTVEQFGYIGVGLVGIITGLNFVVPVPGVVFLPLFTESGLNFYISALVLAVGMSIADMVAFGFGSFGRRIYTYTHTRGRTLTLLKRFRRRHRHGPLVVLALFAMFAPLPNEVIVFPMGLLGYRLSRILPVILWGNFVFNMLYAHGLARLYGLS